MLGMVRRGCPGLAKNHGRVTESKASLATLGVTQNANNLLSTSQQKVLDVLGFIKTLVLETLFF